VESADENLFIPLRKVWLSLHHCYEHRHHSGSFCGHLLNQNQKLGENVQISQILIYTLSMPTAGDIFTEFMLSQQHFVKTSIPNFIVIHQTVWSQVLVHRQMIMWSHKTFSFTGIKATFYFAVNFVGLQGKMSNFHFLLLFVFLTHFMLPTTVIFWHLLFSPSVPSKMVDRSFTVHVTVMLKFNFQSIS